jgi:hypothetical protein
VEHPGSFLFASGGDALKNYYTFLYQAKYGRGTHFAGMFYPYGDHIVYADGQPLLSIPLSWLGTHLSLTNGLIILNLWLLGAIIVAACILYRIMRLNLIAPVPAIIGAVLISFLSPQFERIMGHYGLAYSFIIPLYWYLLIQAFSCPSAWKPLAWYVLVAFAAGLLHPYWVSIAALFALAYALVALLQWRRAGTYSLALVGKVVVAGLLPVVLFQLFMAATDPVTDRPSTPWGFFYYRSSFEAVFYPVLGPMASFWQQSFHVTEPIWEGWAYVGLCGLVVLLLTAIRALRYLLRLKWKLILRPVLPEPLRIGIYAGVLALLFACGIPFVWGLEELLQLIKPLKQFRSIGRFAWIFYYVYTVYVVFYFYQLSRYLRHRRALAFTWGFVLIPLLVWGWEAKVGVSTWAGRVSLTENAPDLLAPGKSYADELAWANLDPAQFQAILPLPFYLIGPDVTQSGSGDSHYESMRASLQTGLPLVSASLSRTSQSRALAVLQLLTDEVVPKTLLNDFPSRKPLLLLVTNDALQPVERQLVTKARLLLRTDRVTLYSLPLEAFEAAPYRQAALAAAATTPPRPDVVRQSWPRQASVASPLGTGTFKGTGLTTLFTGSVPQASDTVHYELSVWVRTQGLETLPLLKVQELAAHSDQVVAEQEYLASATTEIYRGWLRPAIQMPPHAPGNRFRVLIQGDLFEVADLLIRPAYTPVYDKLPSGRWCKNNFPLSD